MQDKNTICPICGSAFHPKYPSQKYCSNPCRHVGKRKRPDATCIECGAVFISRSDNRGKFCSRQCASASRRYAEQHATCALCGKGFSFRGHDVTRGRKYCSLQCANRDAAGRVMHHGYVEIRIDGRYIKEHRLVMEHVLGRQLRADEVVHHINGVRHDNRPENLQVMTQAEHLRLHNLERDYSKARQSGRSSGD